ncbi:MAG TPA: energy transducer TonB [Chryseolinea sp.]|nr:energy transducer TonB [Chryseolinea sp.]
MKKLLLSLIIVVMVVLPQFVFAQDLIVTGRLVDSKSDDVIKGAIVKRADSSTHTNHLGFFKIAALVGDTLQITHSEYGEKFIVVPDASKFTIGLDRLETIEKIYLPESVDKKPEPESGMEQIYRQWGSYVAKAKYPEEAKKNGVVGKVTISFIVDENGEVLDLKVEKGIGYGCDEIALDGFRSLKVKWSPGIRNEQKVKVRMKLTMNFRLN